jgi:hypothetical protein
MTLPCDEHDQALFQASTEIKLGNGRKVIFWYDKWLDSKVPKEIALLLYRLAHSKRRSVTNELQNNN